jgi:hypothetical protein
MRLHNVAVLHNAATDFALEVSTRKFPDADIRFDFSRAPTENCLVDSDRDVTLNATKRQTGAHEKSPL